jgi:hypothetical protein
MAMISPLYAIAYHQYAMMQTCRDAPGGPRHATQGTKSMKPGNTREENGSATNGANGHEWGAVVVLMSFMVNI